MRVLGNTTLKLQIAPQFQDTMCSHTSPELAKP